MNELTISDPVFSSDLGTVTLRYQVVAAPVSAIETKPLRVFDPPHIDGLPFLDFALDRLTRLVEDTTGDDQRYYAELMVLVWFHLTVPSSDQHRRRPFAIASFDRVAPLEELAAMTGTGGRPYVERLLAAAGGPTGSDGALLREAVYRRPDVALPLSEPE